MPEFDFELSLADFSVVVVVDLVEQLKHLCSLVTHRLALKHTLKDRRWM